MTVLPDAEALLIQALKATPEVSILCAGRIGTRLSGTFPAVRVTLLGGPPRPVTGTGSPNLQVECWGNGTDSAAEHQALDLARAVEAAVESLPGVYTSGRIVAAWSLSDLIHSPDSGTSRERYLAQVGLVTQASIP